MHIEDSDFALEDGLLPKNMSSGKVFNQFHLLADKAELSERHIKEILAKMLSYQEKVAGLIEASFLSDSAKHNYLQAYQTRYKKLTRS
jgi:serine/threonine-protein kinase HipA